MFFLRFLFVVALLGCGSSAYAEVTLDMKLIENAARQKGIEGLQQLLQEFPGQEDIMRELLDERRERGSIGVHLPTEDALYDFHDQLHNSPKPE